MGEQLRIQHLVHLRIMRMPVEQIYGSGENRQKHVQIVRHYLNGHAEFSVEFGEHVHCGAWAGQIKIGERFIQHE